MTTINGWITEDVEIKAIKGSPINIGAWIKIEQKNGKKCSGLVYNYESLEYCQKHERELGIGTLVEINGIIVRREDKDFIIIDEGIGIRLINERR